MRNSTTDLTVNLFCHALTELILNPPIIESGDDDLTDVQFACLRFVNLHKEPSIGQIADGLRISNAASTKLIHRLVIKGLVERKEDPADRRVLQIVLTEGGKVLVEKVQAKQTERLDEVLAKMSPVDREAFSQGLKAFLEVVLTSTEQIELVCQRCGWLHLSSCPGNTIYRKLTGQEKITT